MITIERYFYGDGGFFKAFVDEEKAGVMTCHFVGSTVLSIDHTEVEPRYSGRGIGRGLVYDSVYYARDNNLKILPLCPFAGSVFSKYKEIRDVLSEQYTF